MINENAIKRFEAFYKDSEDAFEKNDEAFKNNIERYLNLKKKLYQVDVSINEEFIQRADIETTVLKEGDSVEFLYFMGGGC